MPFSRILSSLALSLVLSGLASAAIAPKGPGELFDAASHVVVGTVESVEASLGEAHFESGWGSLDWHIQVRLKVDAVEKGEQVSPGDVITANAFRPATRRAMMTLLCFVACLFIRLLVSSGKRPSTGGN